jgi:4'-phosphopantetheinyl transferase
MRMDVYEAGRIARMEGWQAAHTTPRIEAGDAHVWLCSLASATSGMDTAMLCALERRRAQAFRKPELRDAYAASHVALRRILAGYLGTDPAVLEFHHNVFGKPSLSAYPELHFNLSHSGGWALIGVSRDGPLGVDVEVHSVAPPLEIAPMVFSAAEQALIKSASSADRVALFYDLWVRKEALVKAIGQGLSLPFSEITVSDCINAEISRPSLPPAVAGEVPWHLFSLPPLPGAAAALAGPHARLRLACFEFLAD